MNFNIVLFPVSFNGFHNVIHHGNTTDVIQLVFVERNSHQDYLCFRIEQHPFVEFQPKNQVLQAVDFGLSGRFLFDNRQNIKLMRFFIFYQVNCPGNVYNFKYPVNFLDFIAKLRPCIKLVEFKNFGIFGANHNYISIFTKKLFKLGVFNSCAVLFRQQGVVIV